MASEQTGVQNAPNPFDPASLKLTQDYGSSIGVSKVLTTVPVRKPSKESWIQIHPDKDFQILTLILELKEDQESYLVSPDLLGELSGEATVAPRMIFTSMTRQGVLFLWPIRMPGPDGRLDSWNRSALQATSMAAGKWVRVAANKPLGAYDVFETKAVLPAPVWPEQSFKDILEIAFRDKFIQSMDHPVLKGLRGEI